MTNYEKIKAMDIEKMAKTIYLEIVKGVCCSAYHEYDLRNKRFLSCKEKIKNWLEREGE